MDRWVPILFATGLLMMVLSAFMAVPAVLAMATGTEGAHEFGVTSAAGWIAGVALYLSFRRRRFVLMPRQMFMLTTFVWLVISGVASIPLLLVSHIGVSDAFFETMSGITTTGSTVLAGLDDMPPAILLWRSILQWIGGIGFVVMGVAILPFLQVGGMRLFQTESSDWSEKAMPKARQVAAAIAAVYVALTGLCGALYRVFGMSPFEAVNHALTTVSTGGYSTSDASFGHFESAPLHVIATIFMLLGAFPFILYVRFRRDHPLALFGDAQVRGMLRFLALSIGLMSLWLVVRLDMPWTDALLLTSFNIISVVTTTGYASADYTQWGPLVVMAFFYLTFIGGCSGSTSGGMKIFRFQLGLLLLRNQLTQLTYPRRVLPSLYNGRPVSDDIMGSVVGFSFAFFVTIGALALFLAWLGLDPITSLSGAATAVTNVGPGLGDIIGPAGNFASLPDAAKWALCAGMLMGRLEVMTVLVLLTRGFWRT